MTLEVEGGMLTEELTAMIEAADADLPAAEHCLLIGEGKGTRLVNGMPLSDFGMTKEIDLRLVPRQRPPPDASQVRMAEAMAQLAEMQVGLACRWDEHHDSVEALESRKLAIVKRHGGGNVKDRLKLTVGGEQVTTKRSTLCTPFPSSKLDALFSGRYENALLRDPKDKKRIFLDLNPECFRKLLEFCVANQGHQPGAPVELPEVAPELEATLHLTFRLFGLDYLFEAAEAMVDEAVPPQEQQPEPEPEGDDGAVEAELITADGAKVALPPRTVDRVISARYGSLDQEAKWIDATDIVAKELDLDGGLELDVNSGTFGADPDEGAEKSLSIHYARCQPWERTPLTYLAGSVGKATADARTRCARRLPSTKLRSGASSKKRRGSSSSSLRGRLQLRRRWCRSTCSARRSAPSARR